MNRRLVLVFSLFAVLALAGCLNSITFTADNLDDGEGDGSASIDAPGAPDTPKTAVSAATDVSTNKEIDEEVAVSSGGDRARPTAPVIRDETGEKIQGFELDELQIARELERNVNAFRTDPEATMMGRHKLVHSASLAVSARFHARRMARNVLGFYSGGVSDNRDVLDELSWATASNLRSRFIRHNAAECNVNTQSFNNRTGDMMPFTADIPAVGENVTAVTYSELASAMGGATASSDEERVADAAFDILMEDEGIRSEMVDGNYKHQGIGVKNVPSERVMVIVQDYCG